MDRNTEAKKARGLTCPVCLTWWGPMLRSVPGEMCGDLSKRQARPCVGRLMPAGDFERAEWVRPGVLSEAQDPRADPAVR